jgi:hypothetical protein
VRGEGAEDMDGRDRQVWGGVVGGRCKERAWCEAGECGL